MALSRTLISYLETALWSSTDNADDSGGAPLDDNYGIDDIAPASLEQARTDLESFLDANADDVAEAGEEQAAHDFWLTRNRHGAWFWDGDWSHDAGRRLTDAAHAFGEVDVYIGDDGQLHFA